MATYRLKAQLEALETENSHLEDELRNLAETRSATDHVLESSSVLEAHRRSPSRAVRVQREKARVGAMERLVASVVTMTHYGLRTGQAMHRTVEEDRAKWEVRKDRLVRQLRELEE